METLLINLVVACVGGYDMEYANKSVSMFRRNVELDVSAYCITDRPELLDTTIKPITPKPVVSGWWNKTLAFSPDMPKGWTVVIDLDVVIIGDITRIIEFAIENTRQIATYNDAVHWHGCKMSSSFMVFKSGSLAHIYEKFCSEWPGIENFPGGDQVWLYPKLDHVLFLDEAFPDFKKSFKVDIMQLKNGKVEVPNKLNPNVRLIDFHGYPKPHQIKHWPLVANNWC